MKLIIVCTLMFVFILNPLVLAEKDKDSVTPAQMVRFWTLVTNKQIKGHDFRKFVFTYLPKKRDLYQELARATKKIPFSKKKINQFVGRFIKKILNRRGFDPGSLVSFHYLCSKKVIKRHTFNNFLNKFKYPRGIKICSKVKVAKVEAKQMIVFWELVVEKKISLYDFGVFLYKNGNKWKILDLVEKILKKYVINKKSRKNYKLYKYFALRKSRDMSVNFQIMMFFHSFNALNAINKKKFNGFLKKIIYKLIKEQEEIKIHTRKKMNIPIWGRLNKERYENKLEDCNREIYKYTKFLKILC